MLSLIIASKSLEYFLSLCFGWILWWRLDNSLWQCIKSISVLVGAFSASFLSWNQFSLLCEFRISHFLTAFCGNFYNFWALLAWVWLLSTESHMSLVCHWWPWKWNMLYRHIVGTFRCALGYPLPDKTIPLQSFWRGIVFRKMRYDSRWVNPGAHAGAGQPASSWVIAPSHWPQIPCWAIIVKMRCSSCQQRLSAEFRNGVKNGPHGPNLRAIFGPIGQYIGFRLFSLKSFHWIHTKLYL